jgi:murein DD-endopeptidase MepM/ murein hydrolase activator NlpD
MEAPIIRVSLFNLILTAIGLITWQNNVRAACSDDWLNVDEVRDGGNIELRATNLREYPITFSMRVRSRDLITDGPKSLTRTLQGSESKTVMTLRENQVQGEGQYRISCDWTVGDQDAEHDDDQVYLFPYANGSSYRLIQAYGSSMSHTGLEQYSLDFYMDVGTPVHAARAGVVARLEESYDKGCWEKGCGKFANYVVVLHDDGTTGEYYHLKQDGVLVDVGQHVSAGEKIALSGNTGHTTTPHLHFAVYRAASWGSTRSVPARFLTVDGVTDNPRRFKRYVATSFRDTADKN